MISDFFRNIALESVLAFTLATVAAAPAAKTDKPKEIDAAIFLAPFNDSLKIDAGSIDEIASKDPLKPDDATTFFLDGETAAKCGKFDAKDFSKMNKNGQIDTGKTGAFFGKFKIVTTPDGKAIQFYDKLSR